MDCTDDSTEDCVDVNDLSHIAIFGELYLVQNGTPVVNFIFTTPGPQLFEPKVNFFFSIVGVLFDGQLEVAVCVINFM